jgi:hypothetical protein
MWTEQEKKKFGTDWTSVPYKAGEVQVTSPAFPHGLTATNPWIKKRRIMLPWFVHIQDDHRTLEVPKSGI